jgi:hypothetical protein
MSVVGLTTIARVISLIYSNASKCAAFLASPFCMQPKSCNSHRIASKRCSSPRLVGHPLVGDEVRAIKRYLGTREHKLPWLIIFERRQPLTRQTVNYRITPATESAGLEDIHQHTLRQSCGYYLATRGRTCGPCMTTSATVIGGKRLRVSARRFEGL